MELIPAYLQPDEGENLRSWPQEDLCQNVNKAVCSTIYVGFPRMSSRSY